MTIYIGLDYSYQTWKTYISGRDAGEECSEFHAISDLHRHLEHVYRTYPGAHLALAQPLEIALTPLALWYEDQQAQAYVDPAAHELKDFLIALNDLALTGSLLPAVRYLPSVPEHRRLMRPSLGSAGMLCIVTTLLYHLREQGAEWSELTFGCLELMDASYRLVVIRAGQIVDGTAVWQPFLATDAGDVADTILEQALLEQLSGELAGLMAIHHCTDVVLLDHTSSGRKDGVIDYFSDLYQFFLSPPIKAELVGFEVAQGASLCAAGLNQSGLAGEIVQRLLAAPETERLDQ
jgi:Protein of unknown function (DUF1464)